MLPQYAAALNFNWRCDSQMVMDMLGIVKSCLVPEEGIEPTHPCGYEILSLARLPVPPLRLFRTQ